MICLENHNENNTEMCVPYVGAWSIFLALAMVVYSISEKQIKAKRRETGRMLMRRLWHS